VVSLQERYGQELGPTLTTQVKWARPYRIYIKNIEEPKLGRELLFVRGKNGEELLAHKGSFPDITLSIDPYGSLASDCNHHPITEASIHVIFEVMDRNFRLAHQRLEGEIRVAGSEMLGERPCKKIEARFVKGGWFHTMKEDETLWDVAHRYGKNMYQILHHNQDKGWEEADDPSAGDQVYIPRYYASRMEVWIDEELNLPIKAQAFDHFGQLYEVFEFRDMRVNTGLTEKDFDEDNPDYDF
jgi:hypothetical protein